MLIYIFLYVLSCESVLYLHQQPILRRGPLKVVQEFYCSGDAWVIVGRSTNEPTKYTGLSQKQMADLACGWLPRSMALAPKSG